MLMILHSSNDILSRKQRMNMKDEDAKLHIPGLSKSYNALLKQHGLPWVIENNSKLAFHHVCLAVTPYSLKSRSKMISSSRIIILGKISKDL